MKLLTTTGLTELITKIKSAFIKTTDVVSASTLDIETTPTQSSTNLITSGAVFNIQDQVNNLKNIGRFLAILDASAGTVSSQPTGSVGDTYAYKVGDYYRIGAAGTYTPKSTATFTIDSTSGSSNFETGSESYSIGDVIYCSNLTSTTSTWVKQASSGGGTVLDVQVNGTTILSGGIANIPIANATLGAVSVSNGGALGININSTNGNIYVQTSTYAQIEEGTNTYKPVTPSVQTLATKKALGVTVTSSTSNSSWTTAEATTARTTIGAQASIQVRDIE